MNNRVRILKLMASCWQYFAGFYVKFKQTNRKFLPWKTSQSINIQWCLYDRNDQHFFCGSMNNFGFLITRESSYQKKTNEDIQLLRCHKMTRIVAPGYSGYHYCTSDAVVYWLSLLHNFIQLSLNSGSAQVQILLAACRRFAMVRISDNGPGWK